MDKISTQDNFSNLFINFDGENNNFEININIDFYHDIKFIYNELLHFFNSKLYEINEDNFKNFYKYIG